MIFRDAGRRCMIALGGDAAMPKPAGKRGAAVMSRVWTKSIKLRSGPMLAGMALIAGAACLGFLRWNWPPAAIFMGDVGSGYLGYTIAVIAIDLAQTSAINVYAWLILGGVFFVDATLTLCRRLLRRERVSQAHRTHAYQWLARRWSSHSRVTVTVIAINLVWLLPCAAFSVIFPQSALWICVLALAPLAVCAYYSGSGRPE